MNEEQKPSNLPDEAVRSLPQELVLLWSRLLQVLRWSWKHLAQFVRHVGDRILWAWHHERAQRGRRRVRGWGKRCVALGRGAMPLAWRATRQLVLVGGLLILVAISIQVGGRFCLHKIEPGTVGVRTSKWGGGGVQMSDFGPGLHLSLPGVHKWHSLSAGTQFLAWPASGVESTGAPLDVRTLDGTSISLSLSVPYRIQSGQAHQLVTEGHRNTFANQARAKAEQVLLSEFGRLRTEDFSRSDVRSELLAEALLKLNTSLDQVHLVAEEILVHGVGFSPAYEKKLVETQRERQRGRVLVARQLEDQEQQTILRRRSEIDRQVLERRIELDREIEDVRVAGQALAVEKVRAVAQLESEWRADADREHDLLIASAEAALERAQDLERRLHGEILSGPGGDQYLALQAAHATRLQEVTLDSNDPRLPNPLDVSGMTRLFGVEE